MLPFILAFSRKEGRRNNTDHMLHRSANRRVRVREIPRSRGHMGRDFHRRIYVEREISLKQ